MVNNLSLSQINTENRVNNSDAASQQRQYIEVPRENSLVRTPQADSFELQNSDNSSQNPSLFKIGAILAVMAAAGVELLAFKGKHVKSLINKIKGKKVPEPTTPPKAPNPPKAPEPPKTSAPKNGTSTTGKSQNHTINPKNKIVVNHSKRRGFKTWLSDIRDNIDFKIWKMKRKRRLKKIQKNVGSQNSHKSKHKVKVKNTQKKSFFGRIKSSFSRKSNRKNKP